PYSRHLHIISKRRIATRQSVDPPSLPDCESQSSLFWCSTWRAAQGMWIAVGAELQPTEPLRQTGKADQRFSPCPILLYSLVKKLRIRSTARSISFDDVA